MCIYLIWIWILNNYSIIWPLSKLSCIFSLFSETVNFFSLFILIQLFCSMIYLAWARMFLFDTVSLTASQFPGIKLIVHCFAPFFRFCRISVWILVFFACAYLWAVRIYFCTVTLEIDRHNSVSLMVICCMNRGGLNYRHSFKDSLLLWLQMRNDHFTITDLV